MNKKDKARIEEIFSDRINSLVSCAGSLALEKLYEDDKDFGTTKAGEILKEDISIDFDEFEINMTALILRINPYAPISFEAEKLEITAKYSLGLLRFKVELEDFDLGDYEGEV